MRAPGVCGFHGGVLPVGGAADSAVTPTGVVRVIPVEAIAPGPYQPRQEPDACLAELTASIQEHGILQPLLVRPAAGRFEIVAGERRWRAAKAAGLATVPAVVREMSDRDAAVMALVENLQREGLSFFDEAEAYRRVLDEFRLSQEELAGQIGVSQSAVANKLRLLRLEAGVRSAISREMLSERHARALLQLDGEVERLEAVRAFAAGDLTVREAEAWVARREGVRAPQRRRRAAAGDFQTYLQSVEQVASGLRRAGFAAQVTLSEDEEGWTVQLRVDRRGSERAAGRRRA